MGALIFLHTPNSQLTPSTSWAKVDQYAFFICLGLFILIHAFFVAWLILVPHGRRRKMSQLDQQHRLRILKKRQEQLTRI